MPSRRDQVEAYSFAANRLRSALLQGEPDAPRRPLRRTPIGLIIGAVLAALVLGVAALLALLKPGSAPGWRQSGVLIIEKETGNRYILIDDRLHPVLNYASARLLLPNDFRTDAVSSGTLADVPRGGQLGIEGAPDLLPRPAGGGTWLICATSTTAVDGQVTPHVTVLLDPPVRPRGDADTAALVRGPDGTRFLVHAGIRMKILTDWVTGALGYSPEQAIPVTGAWLDALPAGPDLGPIDVPGRGSPGPATAVGPTRVGQILLSTEPGPPERYFLVTVSGLIPVNQTVVALIFGDPQTRLAYGNDGVHPVPLDLSSLSGAAMPATPGWAQLPLLPRALPAWTGQVPCVRLTTGGETTQYTVIMLPEPQAQAPPIQEPHTVAGSAVAAGFSAPPGGGALVRTQPAPNATGIGLYLVVETGASYPLANDAAASALGLPAATAVAVPASLLAMLPTGPELRVIGGDG